MSRGLLSRRKRLNVVFCELLISIVFMVPATDWPTEGLRFLQRFQPTLDFFTGKFFPAIKKHKKNPEIF